LGAGLQGAACAFDLLQYTDGTVTLADARLAALPGFLDGAGQRLTYREVDAKDASAVRGILAEHDAVLCALPYYFNFDIARLAVDAGVHFADLGGNTAIVRQQETLDAAARAKGVCVVPDCGLAPGMVNILAADGIGRLDTVDSVKLFVGGLPRHPQPPLNYQIVYSLEGALDYYTTPSWIVRDGKPAQVNALTELESVEFPSPIGTLEAFHTAGGISTMPWDFAGRVTAMEYKTLRYPGHAQIMRAIRDLGLLEVEPVMVKGVAVSPRDAFVAVVDPKLRKPDSPDLVALRVEVRGRRGNTPAAVTYWLLDFYDAERRISAMMRSTGFSLAITGQMLVDGRIGEVGVHPAYRVTPARQYIAELARREVCIQVEDA
jgi:lysine 6-dehydrogenase